MKIKDVTNLLHDDYVNGSYNPMDMEDVERFHYKKHKKLSEDLEEQERILEQEWINEMEAIMLQEMEEEVYD